MNESYAYDGLQQLTNMVRVANGAGGGSDGGGGGATNPPPDGATTLYSNDFENATGPATNMTNWVSAPADRSAITNLTYTGAVPPPLPVAHTRILRLDTQNAILSNQYNNVDLSTEIADMDLMTQFVPCPSTPAACTTSDNGTKFGLFVDARTNLTIYHGVLDANGAWVSNTVDAIAAVQPDPAIWHRVTVTFDATATRPSGGAIEMFQVQIDNAPVSAPAGAYDASWRTNWIAGQPMQPATGGTWWPSATTNANRKKLTAIAFQGTGGVDDLLVTQTASNAAFGASTPIQQAQDWQKTQSWTLEPAGNWSQFRDATNTQTRTHNLFNEITAINGDPNAVTHDPAGNMTRCPSGRDASPQASALFATYDSWNRLTSVTSAVSAVKYTYDADWKRIKKTLADSLTEYYYDDMQLVETRTNGVASEQYVYDTRYLHSVVVRDILAPDSSLRARYFPINDANFNVTSLISTNGAVVERYTYDPYGNVPFRTGDWNPITWDSSTKNIILYTGHKYDAETGFYYSLYRYYHPGLGRWATRDPLMETRDNLALRGVSGKMVLERHADGYGYRHYSPTIGKWLSRDPIGTRGGLNLYGFVKNRPTLTVDALGLVDLCSLVGCCDRCKKDDKPIVVGTGVALKHWNAVASPGTDQIALDLFNDVQLAAKIQAAGGIASACTAVGWLSSVLLEVASQGIDDQMTAGWTDEMLTAIQNIGQNLMQLEGAKIWVHVDWKECKEESCLLFWRRLDWQDRSGWHPCSAGQEGGLLGLGFGMTGAAAADVVRQAIPGCIEEAINTLVP